MAFSFQVRKESTIPACHAHYAPDAIRFTPRDKQKSYFFSTPTFQLPTDDTRVNNASSAMRPLTSMLAQAISPLLLPVVFAWGPCLAVEMVPTVLSVDTSGHTNSGIPYRIYIAVKKCALDLSEQPWIGVDSPRREGTCIETFHIFVDGKPLTIPSKAYDTLADLHLHSVPSLMENGGTLTMQFNGSDGAGSYFGMLVFTDGKLVRRKISEYDAQFRGVDFTIDEKY